MATTAMFKGLLALGAALSVQGALAVPTLWVSDGDGTLGRVDLASGAVSIVGQMGQAMTDIAFNADGELWGVDGDSLYRIDRRNASTRFVANLGTTVNSLAFDADGTLYAANRRLMTVNTQSGVVSPLGRTQPGFESSGDLAFVGGSLYLSSTRPVADTLFRIDATTGNASAVGSGLGVARVYGLATDDNVHLYGLTGQSVVRIDPATGTSAWLVSYSAASGLGAAWGTAFASEAVAAVALPVNSLPVSEPPTAVLMGAAGLLWALRRLQQGARGARADQVPPT
ncbi:hypothetical protein BurJ1DRAFT_4983 [Burkholderiales bacterium JOSHI_001]|nr:hypothetical protein BurJ1DRAFT_4983 [Burkholderiales bacterium JOSHI_001]